MALSKERYHHTRERILAQKKAFYWANRDMMLKKARDWQAINKHKIKAYKQSQHYRELCKKWRAKKTISDRRSWLNKRYGMTIDHYESLLKSQGGVCAICHSTNNHPTRWGNKSVRLSVDHNHATGKIRGLLCHSCNAALGYFKDNPDIIEQAAKYLKLKN